MKTCSRISNLFIALILAAGAVASPGSLGVSAAADEDSYHIHDIQGGGHTSLLVNQDVSAVAGIVTARDAAAHIFYMQDPECDDNPNTSEGILVLTGTATPPAVGTSVLVSGRVLETRSSAQELTVTTLDAALTGWQVVSSGNPLPAPAPIGNAGRKPPATVIEDDAFASFDPVNDGIDFYETMEGMRASVQDALAVSGTTPAGEIAVVADNGGNATTLSERGALVVSAGDLNPERILLDDALIGAGSMPAVAAGATANTLLVGIMDYSAGGYKLQLTAAPSFSGTFTAQTAAGADSSQLSVATFNVADLDPSDTARFPLLASAILSNLHAPDIIALQGVLDNNGTTNDAVTAANLTYTALINAITTASLGSVTYSYKEIAPLDDQDGGTTGGNSRVGFLYRASRVTFVTRGSGGATDATLAEKPGAAVQLSLSPGRIDPTNAAFANNPKPLAGEFTFQGRSVFVIAAQFNPRSGDSPLFGAFQPPLLASQAQRVAQAQVLHNFVDSILALDPFARVVVLGDLNDDDFSPALDALHGMSIDQVLTNLSDDLAENERYSVILDGNARAFDHILVSPALIWVPGQSWLDPAHLNAERASSDPARSSDHDPLLAHLTMNAYGVDASQYPEEQLALQGGIAGYTLTITNSGNTPDTYTFSLSGNSWGPASLAPLPLAAGDTQTVNFNVTPPLGAPTGTVNVLQVIISSSGDPTQTQTFTFTTTKAFTVILPLIKKD